MRFGEIVYPDAQRDSGVLARQAGPSLQSAEGRRTDSPRGGEGEGDLVTLGTSSCPFCYGEESGRGSGEFGTQGGTCPLLLVVNIRLTLAQPLDPA
jgi:hypothetical protein